MERADMRTMIPPHARRRPATHPMDCLARAVPAHACAMSAFTSLQSIGPVPIWGGILARAIHGRDLTLAVVELAGGSVVAEHQHVHEQLGIVLRGRVTFTIGSETRELAAGDTYNIPSNARHHVVTGPDGAVLLDVFNPVRTDWRDMPAAAMQPPLWPGSLA